MKYPFIALLPIALLPFVPIDSVPAGSGSASGDVPQAEIGNGVLHAKLYLPDAHAGFYRGTRFDWSGVISALTYKGHNYYGPWFSRVDPQVHDYQDKGTEIVASTCSGTMGPVNEFTTNHSALGFDEAKVGGTFIKIGVGVLRKDSAQYNYVQQYEIVDSGKWSVRQQADAVEFTHELSDPTDGYAYVYRKTVRLVPGKPEMVLEHSLKNTGRRRIQSWVYNHNFLVLDHQPIGPDFVLTFPFDLHSPEPPDKQLAELRGKQIVYSKLLPVNQSVDAPIAGFSGSPSDNEIRIENHRVGAGMLIRGNRPLVHINFWAMRAVMAVEPFVAMDIEPGKEFTWQDSYQYYTLESKAK